MTKKICIDINNKNIINNDINNNINNNNLINNYIKIFNNDEKSKIVNFIIQFGLYIN